MKILFVAYGYDGNGGSESRSAYSLTKAINARHKITVLTKDESGEDGIINIKCAPILKGTRYYSALKPDYYEFIARCYLIARRSIADYDLIQHISPISFRYPNPLCNLRRSFIWGPVGGSIPYPPGFGDVARKERLLTRLRKIDSIRLAVDPTLRNTLQRAARIIVTSHAARSVLPRRFQKKSVVIHEGITADCVDTEKVEPENYIFSSGRLVPYKAHKLLIRAFAKVSNSSDVQLWVTGDGREKQPLAQLIRELGMGHRVKLVGKVPKAENMRLMRQSLFCVFPALNEAFGHVNLEAMAARKPVIVTDWGGPADIVEEGETGFKVLGANPEDYVNRLTERMHILLDNRDLRHKMGNNAARRVIEHFSWEVLGKKHDALYNEICREDRRAEVPPVFWTGR